MQLVLDSAGARLFGGRQPDRPATVSGARATAIKIYQHHETARDTSTPSSSYKRARVALTHKPISPVIINISLVFMLIACGAPASKATSGQLNQFATLSQIAAYPDSVEPDIVGPPLALVYSDEKPRLIPLVAAESGYSENSSVNILCTVSQGHHDTLTFDWFKDGQLLLNYDQVQQQQQQQQVAPLGPMMRQSDSTEFGNSNLAPPQIEKHSDHSLLRVSRVHSQHSGRYTCTAKNQFGQDSSSVNLIVNVKLQWIREPPKEVVVSVNQELKVDCLAQGEPRPTMRWEKLDSGMSALPRARAGARGGQFQLQAISSGASTAGGDAVMIPMASSLSKNQLATKVESNGYKLAQQQHPTFANGLAGAQNSIIVSSNRHLNIQRAKESDAGIYECVASNSHDADLRKLVHVQVRGPPKILPIATADSYPEGSSINLICTVSGGQRRGLVLSWMMDGEELDDRRLKYSGAFDNLSIGTDDADISILRIKNATNANSGQYTCTAKNPLGQDSTSVKIVINVELKWNKIPKDVEIGLNQELNVECDAVGQPQPTIEWIKHSSSHTDRNSSGTMLVSKNKILRINKAQHKDSGLYECVAKNGVDDDLRKIIQVKVRVSGQQNGEVMVPNRNYGQHYDSKESLATPADNNVKIQYVNVNGLPVLVQFTYVGPPKILPIATADSYPEGSTINLICTVSGGQRKGLTLAWSKDGEEFNEQLLRYSSSLENVSIEKTGVDISILRITNATHVNSGRFACNAKNPLGEDSTAVNIVINVELKWLKLPAETEIGLNQDVTIECDATGQPQPQITWTKHPSSNGRSNNDAIKSVVVSQGKLLKITKAQHKDSGLYECTARNGVDQDLRRIIQIKVRGKLLHKL